MNAPASSQGPVLSWPRKVIFGVTFAAVILLGLLVLTEVTLRVAGFGHAAGFWRKEKDASGKRWLRENWWVTIPYFAPELVRRPQPFRLPEEKERNAYRIFVLGSSAAMGDPEPSFSIARTLDVLLREAYPQVRFEVVNAAITAVNSHVVRGIAEDCAELAPDLFFVYEGNNEVIGPFGPGTVFTSSLRSERWIRLSTYLRSLRVGQLLGSLRPATHNLKDWGGMEMFLRHEIPLSDPRLADTRALFQANLRAIVRAGERAGARVVLGTVLTNQKDFSPFRSLHTASLSPDDAARAEALLQQASGASDPGSAENALREAIRIDPGYAELHYRLGRVLLARGQNAEARNSFRAALDLDALRFRTDSGLNEVIRRVAAEMPAARGLDLEQLAEKEAPGGVLGDEFLYEHVHLSFRGTYLVARELFHVVAEDLRAGGRVASGTATAPLSADEVRQRLAFTTYEQAMIGKEMLARLQRPPFTLQSSNPERLSAFAQRDARASKPCARFTRRRCKPTLVIGSCDATSAWPWWRLANPMKDCFSSKKLPKPFRTIPISFME